MVAKESADYASVCAVGRQNGHCRLDSGDEGRHEEHPYPIAQPLVLLAEMEGLAVLAGTFCEHAHAGNAILHDPQRAYGGTIDAPEQQGEHYQGDDDDCIQRHHGREELQFRHPSEPAVQSGQETGEQKTDSKEKQQRKSDANLFHIM